MLHTYVRQLEMTCLECGKVFSADVPMIVDVNERPDLLERIRSLTLHWNPCPHCGHMGHLDAPLLVFRSDQAPHLMFLLAYGMAATWNQEQAKQLIARLKKALGWGWRDEWLRSGLASFNQEGMLAAALTANPQAAMAEYARQQDKEGQRLKTEDPDRYYRTLLNYLMSAQDPSEKHEALASHPDLLSDRAREVLLALLEKARAQGNLPATETFQKHLDLLDEARVPEHP